MFKKIIKLTLVIIWLIVIFYFSNQDGSTSGNLSNSVLNLFANFFKINLETFPLDLTIVLRKTAHFLEYVILAILVNLNFKEYISSTPKSICYTIIFCFLVSLTDEFHQTFIIARSGNLLDVYFDTLGILAGTFLSNLKKPLKTKT